VIVGAVTNRHEPVVRLAVRNSAGADHDLEAILDTGFNGFLTLPPALVASLGLPWRSRATATLASGEVGQFETHAATIVWAGTARRVLVQAIDSVPLLGMRLLVGYDLKMRVLDGGAVQVERVP
jgi:clan AA aspartic protease